jgi:hypothetical protein
LQSVVSTEIKLCRLRWAEHITRLWDSKRNRNISAGNPNGKDSIGVWRSRWKDNIKKEPQEGIKL